MSYSSFLEASVKLYQEAKYREAYDMITCAVDSPDSIPALVYYLRYSFASRAGMLDLAMDLLREAVIDEGYWYSAEHLGDDDLEPLRSRSEFQSLVELCSKREAEASQKAFSEMDLIQPHSQINGAKAPLVVAMHGNQLNILTTGLIGAAIPCLIASSPFLNPPGPSAAVPFPGSTLPQECKRSSITWIPYSAGMRWTGTGSSWEGSQPVAGSLCIWS